jgi:galactose mutarotase-like enzyme
MARSRFEISDRYPEARLLVLENDQLKLVLIPEKGSDMVEIVDKRTGHNLLFASPFGFRSYSGVSALPPTSDASFLDHYEGGWQDILPNPGYASTHRGASWGLHGETSLLPWEIRVLDESNNAIVELSVMCVRYPIRIRKRIELSQNDSRFCIHEEASNLAEQEVEFGWLQHIVFGEPLIGPGMHVDLRAREALTVDLKQSRLQANRQFTWPLAPALAGASVDLSQAYPSDLRFEDEAMVTMAEPWYAIRNTRLNITATVSWTQDTYKYLWYWLNIGSLDYPWFGKARNLGLEPCTSIPDTGLAEYVRKRTAMRLKQRESLKSQVVFSVFNTSKPVERVEEDGTIRT